MKVGDKIKLYDVYRAENSPKGNVHMSRVVGKVWTVAGFYPYVVLLVDRYGNRECFSYWYLRRHMRAPVRKVIHNQVYWEWGEGNT